MTPTRLPHLHPTRRHRARSKLGLVVVVLATLVGSTGRADSAGLTAVGAPSAAVALSPRVTGRVEVVKISATNSLSPKTATAQCPAGKQVLGGGAFAPYDEVTLIQMEPFVNGAGRHNYSVTAAEVVPGTARNWRLSAYAICADPLPGHDIVAQATGWSSTSLKETAAACPSGQRVFGTGARVNPFGTSDQDHHGIGLQVVRTDGPGTITRAQAREHPGGYAANWQLLAFAVCADRTTGYTVRAALSDTDGTEPVKQARIDCPIVRDPLTHTFVRMKIVNAGGAVTNAAPGNITLSEVYPFAGEVIVTGRENTPTSAEWVVQAQAVCAL